MKNALFVINSQSSVGFSIVILCEALVLLRGARCLQGRRGIAAQANPLPAKVSRFFACVASERVYP